MPKLITASLCLLVTLTFVGCQAPAPTNLWIHQTKGTNEFNIDKYECSNSASNSVSPNNYRTQNTGTAWDGLSGIGKDMQYDNAVNNYFSNCMYARGWYLQSKEAYQAATNENKLRRDKKAAEMSAQFKMFGDRFAVVCKKDEYAEIILKSPCDARQVTFEQMADNTKISTKLKPIFVNFMKEIDVISAEFEVYARANAELAVENEWLNFNDAQNAQKDKNRLDLYNRKITWGQYVKVRKDLASKADDEKRRLFTQKTN